MRDLRAGGARCARGLPRLHKDWYHAPVAELVRLLSRAGMPPECLSMVEEVVRKCISCRKWDLKPIKPIARTSLAEHFNDLVWVDLCF